VVGGMLEYFNFRVIFEYTLLFMKGFLSTLMGNLAALQGNVRRGLHPGQFSEAETITLRMRRNFLFHLPVCLNQIVHTLTVFQTPNKEDVLRWYDARDNSCFVMCTGVKMDAKQIFSKWTQEESGREKLETALEFIANNASRYWQNNSIGSKDEPKKRFDRHFRANSVKGQIN
jgi:hypothetical protein